MVYDAARREVLLFGGYAKAPTGDSLVHPNDVWAWNGATWRRLDAGGPDRPGGRAVPHLVYDAARQRVVMFGGRSERRGNTTILSDLWEWDGTRWHAVPTAATPAILHAVTGYDPARRRVVVYGGLGDAGFSRTLREWDGTRWEIRDTAGPAGVFAGAAAVTPRGELLITTTIPSGDRDPIPDSSKTWVWTGTSWKAAERGPPFANLQPTTSAPDGTLYFYQVADRWLREPVMHVRGTDGRWSSFPAPLGRDPYGAQAAFDAARGRLVIYGGGRASGQIPDETWELNGQRLFRR